VIQFISWWDAFVSQSFEELLLLGLTSLDLSMLVVFDADRLSSCRIVTMVMSGGALALDGGNGSMSSRINMLNGRQHKKQPKTNQHGLAHLTTYPLSGFVTQTE
jgi:hypothetical protein